MILGTIVGCFISVIAVPVVMVVFGIPAEWWLPLMVASTIAIGALLNHLFWID